MTHLEPHLQSREDCPGHIIHLISHDCMVIAPSYYESTAICVFLNFDIESNSMQELLNMNNLSFNFEKTIVFIHCTISVTKHLFSDSGHRDKYIEKVAQFIFPVGHEKCEMEFSYKVMK